MPAHTKQTPASKKTKDAPAPQASEDTKKRRNLMTEILDISISNARCQSHMKAALVPADLEASIGEKRAEIKSAKEDDKDTTELKKELDELTEGVVRIGGDAPIAIAALSDYVVKSTMRYAMDNTLSSNHKMVEISSLHNDDCGTELEVWPLICDLPSISSYDPEHEALLKADRAEKNKAQKEAREAKKTAGEQSTKTQATNNESESDEADGESPRVSTTFHTYVDAATKMVKKEETYSTMRVSNRVREVLSQMVAELVARYSHVAKVVVLELLGVRTLNASHINALVKSIYISKVGVDTMTESGDNLVISPVLDYISEKVRLYHEHLEQEKERKLEEMDPEEKAKLEEEEVEKAKAKKRRDAENAKNRARKMAAKAKELDTIAKKAT